MSFQMVIVCRSAKESLSPGALLGFHCAICSEPLQLTPSGKERYESTEGASLLCNPCGLLYVYIADETNHGVETQLSPHAKSQLDQGNDSGLAHWIRKHTA